MDPTALGFVLTVLGDASLSRGADRDRVKERNVPLMEQLRPACEIRERTVVRRGYRG